MRFVIAPLALLLAIAGCDRRAAPTGPSQLAPGPAPTLSSAAQAAPVWPNTRLASSSATTPFIPTSIEVVISENDLRAAGRVIAVLPAVASRSQGFSADVKRSANPNELMLDPLSRAIEPLSSKLPEPVHAHVVVDRATSYRLLIEVLFTLGQSNVAVYDFPVQNGDRTMQLTVSPPSTPFRPDPATEALNLGVQLVQEGISVKGAGANVGPGCEGVKPGVAFPRTGPSYDFSAARACVEKLRASNPAFAEETRVVVSANPQIDFQTVVQLMDALRVSETGKPLFTDVQFAVSR